MLDLPLPDSPTSASVLPAGTRRSTLRAATCQPPPAGPPHSVGPTRLTSIRVAKPAPCHPEGESMYIA